MKQSSEQATNANDARLISTTLVLELVAGMIDPPPCRRTVMAWLRKHKVRHVKLSAARRGGGSVLWVRADVEKFVRGLVNGS